MSKRATLPSRRPRATETRASDTRIGFDVVCIDDVAHAISRFGDRYTARVFTPMECAYCRTASPRPAMARFAARFAAKEAVVKVLRPARPWSDWRDIEVRRHPSGWCDIRLHNEAASLAKRQHLGSMTLSMTHSGRHAAAVVLARAGATARPTRSR